MEIIFRQNTQPTLTFNINIYNYNYSKVGLHTNHFNRVCFTKWAVFNRKRVIEILYMVPIGIYRTTGSLFGEKFNISLDNENWHCYINILSYRHLIWELRKKLSVIAYLSTKIVDLKNCWYKKSVVEPLVERLLIQQKSLSLANFTFSDILL